jgi:hypothetical protein
VSETLSVVEARDALLLMIWLEEKNGHLAPEIAITARNCVKALYEAARPEPGERNQPMRVVNHSCGDPKCTDLSHLEIRDLPPGSGGYQE